MAHEYTTVLVPSDEEKHVPIQRTMTKPDYEDYRDDVDGLRAFAVTAVVIYHLNKSWLPGGFVGVDIFFVISGYVVTGSLLRSSEGDGYVNRMVEFYTRRVKRLIPAFVVVACASGLSMALLVPPSYRYLQRCYEAGLFGVIGNVNNFLAAQKSTYFDEGADSLDDCPFKHMWSLGVEEQFYMIFPAMLISLPRYSAIPIGTALLLSLFGAFLLQSSSETLAFYLLPARFWELAAGALLYLGRCQCSRDLLASRMARYGSICLQLISVALLGSAIVITPEEVGFPVPWALLAVAGAICFIAAGMECQSEVNRCFACDFPVYVGKASYSIYLWHYPVITLTEWAVGSGSSWTFAAVFATILVLSLTSYHIVETPIRAWKPTSKWQVFFATIVTLSMVTCELAILQGPLEGKLFLFQETASTGGCTFDISVVHHSIPADDLTAPTDVSLPGSSLQCECSYVLETFHKPPGAKSDCAETAQLPPCAVNESHLGFIKTDVLEGIGAQCFFAAEGVLSDAVAEFCLKPDRGADDSGRAFFLLGDSHANMLVPAIRMAVQTAMSFRMFTVAFGCGYIPPLYYSAQDWGTIPHIGWEASAQKRQSCRSYNEQATAAIQRVIRPGDIVAIANSDLFKTPEFVEHCPTNFKCQHGSVLADAKAYYMDLYQKVRARSAYVLHFGDSAYIGVPHPEKCKPTKLNPSASKACEVSSMKGGCSSSMKNAMLKELASTHPGTFYFDYKDLGCQGKTCGALIPGTNVLAYFDDDHYGARGSFYLWPFMCNFLKHMLHNVSELERQEATSKAGTRTDISRQSEDGDLFLPTKDFSDACPFAVDDVSVQEDLPSPRGTNLQCECSYAMPTFHKPPGAKTSCSDTEKLPACAVNKSYLAGQGMWGPSGQSIYPCFVDGDKMITPMLATKCLKPDRGPDDSRRAFFLLGDTHATMLANGVNMAVKSSMSFRLFTIGGGCGYLPSQFYKVSEIGMLPCWGYNNQVTASLQRFVRAGDIVAVANSDKDGKRVSFVDYCPTNVKCQHGSVLADAKAYYMELYEIVRSKNASLLFFGDGPVVADFPTFCNPASIDSFDLKQCQVDKSSSGSTATKGDLLRELASTHPGIFYFDYHDLLCYEDKCGANIPGTDVVTYFDSSHFQQHGSYYLWPFICDFLKKIPFG